MPFIEGIDNQTAKNRKTEIIEATLELASRNGLGTVSMQQIADRVGITRSVIVNALRKLESAGVIESRSSGMKGTYIKVLNDAVFDEIEKLKKDKTM